MISICVKCNNGAILDKIILFFNKLGSHGLYISKHSFKVFDNIVIHYVGESADVFYKNLSDILYSQIIEYFEPCLVKRLLNQNYFYFDESDKKIILDEYELLKERGIYDEAIVKKIIYTELRSFLPVNKCIVLSGFVNFKVPAYIQYLENMINESVNQYLIDKEYIRFVNLLKNYVQTQVPCGECYHLIYTNSNAILLSGDGNLVDLENFKSRYVSDISFSKNDLILNTLVSKVPRKIVIHLVSPRDQFIKTIEMIFSRRVQICTCCELCKTYKILEKN